MRFFKEIEVAEVCYLMEAVHWIVRGQVPEFIPDERGQEVRGNLVAFLEDYHIAEEPLTAKELEHFQVDLSYTDYLDVLYGYEESPALSLPSPLTQFSLDQWQVEWTARKAENEAKRKTTLRGKLWLYDEQVERAKTRVMSAILEGRLTVKGFWAESMEDFYEPEVGETAVAEAIPADAVSPSLFDWDENTLVCRANKNKQGRSGAFHLVTLETRAMQQVFSAPHEELAEVAIFNGNAVIKVGSESTPQPSGKRIGRPPKAPWLRDGMRAWYAEQCRKGVLGKGKVEADLAACEAWAANSGIRITRGTVQFYLSELLKARG